MKERGVGVYYFNHQLIKIIIFLVFMNSTRLFLNVHCSSGATKDRFYSTTRVCFCDCGAKIYQHTYVAQLL